MDFKRTLQTQIKFHISMLKKLHKSLNFNHLTYNQYVYWVIQNVRQGNTTPDQNLIT
jgi:hypothetical protein